MTIYISNVSASFIDLKDALTETLEANGVLGKLKAKIQAEIFAVREHRK